MTPRPVTAGPVPLLLGVGNEARGDDGVGAVVVRRAAADRRLATARAITVAGLTPELVADVAAASVVVVVDAAVGTPGHLSWSALAAPASPPRSPFTHHLSPRGLVALAGLTFGRVPPSFVVEIGAETFDHSGRLSDRVDASVADAAALVVGLATGAGAARGV